VVLIYEQLSVAVLVVALVTRAVTALIRRRYLWLWSACAAMTISIGIYVAAVVPWPLPWTALDECGLAVNIWGLGTSVAIASFSALANDVPPRRVVLVTTAYLAVSVSTVLRGLGESPSPIGCLDRLHVPWWDVFWWLLIAVHVGSTTYAGHVCWRLAQVAGSKRAMRADFLLLGAGMVSSTVFWLGILTILVTGDAPLILPLQYLICTTALALAAGLVWGYVGAGVERAVAVRRYRRLEPLHRYLAATLGEAPLPSPSLVTLLCSAYTPKQRLYRLAMTIGDGLLEVSDFAAGRRGDIPGAAAADIRRIHETVLAAGWEPGRTIDTAFALRVANTLPIERRGHRTTRQRSSVPATRDGTLPGGARARSGR
jgi:hypothetical protein